MNPPIQLRLERDFGAKLNVTFQFAVQNFKPLLACLLYLVAPVALLAGVVGGLYQSKALSGLGGLTASKGPIGLPADVFSQFFTPEYWFYIGFSALSGLVLALTVAAFLAEYEAAGSRPPSVGQVWQRVSQTLASALGLWLCLGFIVIVGFVLLVIPGIYATIALSLSLMALVQEQRGIGAALSRSNTLVQQKWWSTFGLVVVMSILTGIISYVFQIPVLVVTMLKTFQVISGDQTLIFIVTTMLATLGTTLVQSLVMLAMGFQYYNLVELKDGTGLLRGLDQLGTAPQPLVGPQEGEY